MKNIYQLFFAGVALAIGACAHAPPAQNKSTPAAVPFPQFNSVTYAINVGDSVRIAVFQEDELSGIFIVESDGHINYPLLGRLPAAGEYASTLERRVQQGLSRGYLVAPDVRASIAKYKPVFVGGEVRKSGEYPFSPGLTVQQAVTLAGGATRFASETFYVQKLGHGPASRFRATPDTTLSPGDVVTVDERLF